MYQPNRLQEYALDIFNFQFSNNLVYQNFCLLTKVEPKKVRELKQIPYLPISFFKTHTVTTFPKLKEQLVFESSGTTAANTSKHFIYNPSNYNESLLSSFNRCFGAAEDWVILALLPGYLERKNASLVYMVEKLIHQNNEKLGGFYLNEKEALRDEIQELFQLNKKVLLIGVTHALLDFHEEFGPFKWPQLHILETGGMKGLRKEIIKEELHQKLAAGFGTPHIYSEYGMTELLSQAYSKPNKGFVTPNWMRISLRDISDPLQTVAPGKTGAINVMDLANIESCAFIATDDLGKQLPDGSFEVLGRLDHSDARGCNLMTI